MKALALKKVTFRSKKSICGYDSARTLELPKNEVRLTLAEGVVLIERIGYSDMLVPLFEVDSMVPLEDLSPGDFGKPKKSLQVAKPEEETEAA